MTASALRIARARDSAPPHESALRILSLFEQWNKIPGMSLAKRRFMMLFQGGYFRDSDLLLGLGYAVQRGWLRDNGKFIQLLAAGFAEMHRAKLDEMIRATLDSRLR